MGICHGKNIPKPRTTLEDSVVPSTTGPSSYSETTKPSSNFPFLSPSPLPSAFKNSPANSSRSSTPLRIFKRPFPPPSPAKHIKALLARRHGSVKPNEASIPEGEECEVGLDKNFGFAKQFFSKYELGEEVGRGHFGYTCSAKAKKGELKGQEVAAKVIPKSKVETTGPENVITMYKLLELSLTLLLQSEESICHPEKKMINPQAYPATPKMPYQIINAFLYM